MAELLLKVDPVCLQPNEQAGLLVAANEDEFGWTEEERKLFVVAKTSLTKEQAEAKYKKLGVPDELVAAYFAAMQETNAAATVLAPLKNEYEAALIELAAAQYQLNQPVPEGADIVAVAAARQVAVSNAQQRVDDALQPKLDAEAILTAKKEAERAAQYDPTQHPARTNYIDISLIPQAAIDVVNTTRQALTACAEEAGAAARAAVEDTQAVTDLNLDQEVVDDLKTSHLTQIAQREISDQAAEEISAASAAGRKTVEGPVLQAITAHGVVDLTNEDL